MISSKAQAKIVEQLSVGCVPASERLGVNFSYSARKCKEGIIVVIFGRLLEHGAYGMKYKFLHKPHDELRFTCGKKCVSTQLKSVINGGRIFNKMVRSQALVQSLAKSSLNQKR